MPSRNHEIEALFQEGRRLHDSGAMAEAEAIFRQILADQPGHPETLHRLGLIALQVGQAAAALELLDQAVARKRLNAAAHVHRGHALLALGQPQEALAAGRKGLQLKRTADAQTVIGHALNGLGRPKEAVAAYREALRLQPNAPDVHNALGLALREAYQPDAAIAALREALRRDPNDEAAAINLASMLKDTGALTEAEAMYRRLLKQYPNNPVIPFNLGVLLLLAGRYEEAWPYWEKRFQADPSLDVGLAGPVWMGQPLGEQTLLVHAEQGLGDVLQFARYLNFLPTGVNAIFRVPAPLVRLMAQHWPNLRVVSQDDPLPPYDFRVPMMSLPLALGHVGRDDAAIAQRYLQADPAEVAAWRERLAHVPHPRIGIVWAGNPARVQMDRRRSVDVTTLAPLAKAAGVSLVSLQTGPAAAALANSPLAGKVIDQTDKLTDFASTAALVENLDLVIGVDTAAIHLAGAMGKPTWLLNRLDTCWRWGVGEDTSIWYPALRQFRQTTTGDWSPVVIAVSNALRICMDIGSNFILPTL